MDKDARDEALGATLVAEGGAPSPPPDGTLAVGSAPGDPTMVSQPRGAPHDSPVPRPSIRAGTPTDYTKLVEVAPAHYIRGRELARGGMGRIVVARDRRLGRDVAIKEVAATDDALRTRFEREARITARLQHPSTISLHEAGVWPTGEPFYAMQLVAGRPLDKAIAEAKTREARFALLQNVLAVADTVAYAHERGIVHRDLKPANILVGDFGETVVIDWGLAKDLNVEEAVRPSQRSLSGSASRSGETEHGSVIGTPAYMPPEQADGDIVDERADVYAIGAVLYQVLSGAPPYSGRTSEAVLVQVLAGPPTPLTDIVPDLPRDLVTIVHKAMARDPAKRFRTAKELAAELRKFQTGQLVGSHDYTVGELVRRWIRRNRAPLAVAAVAAIALAVVGVISIRRVIRERTVAEVASAQANTARELAVQRAAESRELVAFILDELKEKLSQTGQLPLLDTAVKKVSDYYDRRGTEGETQQDRILRVHAIVALSDILVSRGKFEPARAESEKAVALYKQILATDPTNRDALFGLGNAQIGLAEAAGALADSKGTAAAARDGMETLKQALARYPDVEIRMRLIEATRILGDTQLDLGDGPAAEAAYKDAIALAEEGLKSDPDNHNYKRALGIVRSQMGALMMMMGNVEGAVREQREDVRLSEEVHAHLKDTPSQNDVAGAHLRLGDVLLATGDAESALKEFRASLATMKHLTLIDPTNADWMHDRCACHDRIGNVLLARGDTAAARSEYEACRELRLQIVARTPKGKSRRNLGVSHNKLGSVLETEKKYKEALAEYEKGRPLFEAAVGDDPDNAMLKRDLAVSHYLIAEMQLATGRRAAALEAHKKALQLVEGLVAKDPTNAIWQADAIESQIAVGRVLASMNDREDAKAAFTAALGLADAAAKADPQNPQWAAHAKTAQDALAKLK